MKYETEWLKAALENFDEARKQGNTELAKAVADDIDDRGYKLTAQTLREELAKK